MYPRIATNLDQNPARIHAVRSRMQNQKKPVMQAAIGIQLLLGTIGACFWNYLPI